MTISELAGALREVNVALEQAREMASNAVPLLADSRAALLVIRQDTNGYHPVELDLAMSQLGTAGDLIARAQQLILDYLMRL